MAKIMLVLIAVLTLAACAEIRPMELPDYSPPDLSGIKRPAVPAPVPGVDFKIDPGDKLVTYTVQGQDKITALAESESLGWQSAESCKQIVALQSETIKSMRHLVVIIDLERQYAQRGKTNADIKQIAAEILALVAIALTLAK